MKAILIYASLQNRILSFKNTITAYDLFALTVVIMIIGHIGYYFYPDNTVIRIPDRILVPVFLISVGYNTGYKISKPLIVGSILLTGITFFLYQKIYIDMLGVILILRLTLEPLAEFMIKNKMRFWAMCFALLLLSPITAIFFEYGTAATILAMAGWINRNRAAVSNNIVETYQIYIFSYFSFLLFTQIFFYFSYVEFIVMSAGNAVVFWLLYDFRSLLLNSIKRRPKDLIERICHFLGHKSLEIYILHMIAFQGILLYALMTLK